MIPLSKSYKEHLDAHRKLNLSLIDDVQKLKAKVKEQARELDYIRNKLSTAGVSPERVKVKNS